MNTSTIQKKIIQLAINKRHYLVTKNFYFFKDWECDVLSVSYNDMVTEYEIKKSRNDFKADFNKKDKHFSTSNGYGANYFYYACPVNLISVDEIPEYSGLIYCTPRGGYIMKQAPILHQETLTFKQLKKIANKIMSSKYV
tara:strand:- start:219 stop:638 length:420 start_codon:yes stop_codon:yes gene_type:complete